MKFPLFLSALLDTRLWWCSPGPALSVRSVAGAAAVSDIVTVDGDELLAALRRLLLLPKPVVLPATLVLPQLPVSTFRSERTHTGRHDALKTSTVLLHMATSPLGWKVASKNI